MGAAGDPLLGGDVKSLSIDDLLARYLTSTEKSKAYGHNVKKLAEDSKPRPLREMTFESTAKRARDIKEMNNESQSSKHR